jgi:EAL domain-containing protein (putative c-di-GMP-specific phosphodiesterase class I)
MVDVVLAALADDRLRTDSQPIVSAATGDKAAEELLVRLVTENGELLYPDEFLPASERHGLMPKIDRFVIARAAELAAAGRFVHVNLSATTIADFQLFGDILTTVHELGSEPSRITFEITETAATTNMGDASRLADKLRAFGFRIAVDDFGAGWGAFRYLAAMPIDMIKIDREFVKGLRGNIKTAKLIRGMVTVAQVLGMTTVAEGVEDEQTLIGLQALGVDYAQGFHIARPEPTELPTRQRGVQATRLVRANLRAVPASPSPR